MTRQDVMPASDPASTARSSGFRRYVVLWCGQFVSMIGSFLSSFALGVYVYELTGSSTKLGFVFALSFLPMIIVSPLAGSLVDRWGTRRALLVSNVGAMVIVLILALLLYTHVFAVWNVYIITAAISVLSALQMPAFSSSVPLLVAKQQLGRANGMRVLAMAASQVLGPVTAGALLLAIHISGIVLMDCVSYGLAVITLLFVRIPRPISEDAGDAGTESRSLLADFGDAWRYVVARRGLLALLLFIGVLNFCAGFVDLLITPLVLAFGSPGALGTVLSIGGLGAVATSIAMSVWRGSHRNIVAILASSLVIAVATIVGSTRPNVALITVGAFFFLAGLGVIIGSNQTIWQTKVEARLLGRVMALQNMVTSAPQLLAYAVAGIVADRVFQPLVGRNHVESQLLQTVVGQGPGRGYALLLMLMGVLIALLSAVAFRYPRLRLLEEELPDVMQEDEKAAARQPVSSAV